MAKKLKTIAFDADDTLWHNERFFRDAQQEFANLLAPFVPQEALMRALETAELRNLRTYGFGVKGFILSMIETAIETSDGAVPSSVISQLMDSGREMLNHPIELLPGVVDTLEHVSKEFRLVVITKGDLIDQERKVEQSGLAEYFDAVEVVSDKTPSTYSDIFSKLDGVEHSMMVGNSLKSDVLPALEAGSWGVHVPHELTWSFERAVAPDDTEKFKELDQISDLPTSILTLVNKG